jgi:hypothetical protein
LSIPIVDENGESAWPEVFTDDAIDALRATVGARHFSAQMMLAFLPTDRARLCPDAVQFYDRALDRRTARLGDVLITGTSLYWDPSSARRGADSSVCVLVLHDGRTKRAFVHDLRYLRVADDDLHPMASQCHAVLDFMAEYAMRHIAIEVNGLGNAMPEILRDTASRRDQAVLVQKIINNEKKERRILNAIEPLLSTGRLYMHERIKSSDLIDEMADWNPASTVNPDDGLDAVAGALRNVPIPLRPRGQTVQPIAAQTAFNV